MIDFALTAEGPTDQAVIENILYGYFDDPNLVIAASQPLRDASNKVSPPNFGGWCTLLEYCASDKFKQNFSDVQYQIIQIDTDACEHYGVARLQNGQLLDAVDLVSKVIELLIKTIGKEFYDLAKERIIFAVAVESIECWLLPLVMTEKKRGRTRNCDQILAKELRRQNKGELLKTYHHYLRLSDAYSKQKTLLKLASTNASLGLFVRALSASTR